MSTLDYHSATADMHPLIIKHRAELLALAERNRLTDVRLFGSMARGDYDENSDVDLLVTPRTGASASLLDLAGLMCDAEDLLGKKVDVLTERGLRPAIRERILQDAVPL